MGNCLCSPEDFFDEEYNQKNNNNITYQFFTSTNPYSNISNHSNNLL